MSRYHLAQMNVGTAVYDMTDPRMTGFVDRLDEINKLAEQSPGFIWRLQSDSGNATDIILTDNPRFIVNMSVWASAETLFEFTYRSAHRPIMTQRRQWFEHPKDAYQVLWWVDAGHRPDPHEGLARLQHLRERGASERAFTFKKKFPPPDEGGGPQDLKPEPYCSGWT